jgi:type VII secretion protein EccB
MVSTRDQVEAYTFATRRQVLALLRGDDAVATDPRRRLNRSLIGGALVAVVALAVTGVLGFLSGGGSASLPKQGVIVDASSGAAYVRIGDIVHPALNVASAKLIAGPQVTKVSASALGSAPRGLPVGIPGAPDALPPPGRLSRGGWTVCSTASQANAARPQVVVSIGATVPRPLPAGAAAVVRPPDGTAWLLDDGMRYQVGEAAATLLRLDQVSPVPIEPAVLQLVPEGPPLAVPALPDAGSPPAVSLPFGAAVGDLLKVDNGTAQPGLYVVLADGVAPVDPFAYALLAGGARQSHTVPASDIVSVPAHTRPPIPGLWPKRALTGPVAPPPGEPLCVSYDPAAAHTAAAWPVTVSEPTAVPLAAHATPVLPASGSLPTAATAIAVPAGSGALVKATAAGGVDGVYTLVTDSGLRFGVADAGAVGRLGYDAASAVPVPLPFVALLPAGPGLDPTAAAVEYGGAAQPPAAATGAPASSAPTS